MSNVVHFNFAHVIDSFHFVNQFNLYCVHSVHSHPYQLSNQAVQFWGPWPSKTFVLAMAELNNTVHLCSQSCSLHSHCTHCTAQLLPRGGGQVMVCLFVDSTTFFFNLSTIYTKIWNSLRPTVLIVAARFVHPTCAWNATHWRTTSLGQIQHSRLSPSLIKVKDRDEAY